ncbi:MAG TPA: extracellular solute-binding protein, partial [Polyangiaceae bacterium]
MSQSHRPPAKAPRRAFLLSALLGLALVSISVGCRRPETKPAPAAKKSELVVFAAASLREAFGTMKGAFEKTRPGVEVTFNFAGSQELRTQIEHGASVDVFASADQRHMGALRT